MPSLVGPSHHVYYGSLCRRYLWLQYLAKAFEFFAPANWDATLSTLNQNYRTPFRKLSSSSSLGLNEAFSLRSVLDDTPIDSFLANISEQLDRYETQLLELMQTMAVKQGWVEDLDRVSMLWGRELAQECLVSSNHGDLVRNQSSVRGVFEAIQNVIEGGQFIWRPFLLRRYTDNEIQFELRHCPHRRYKSLIASQKQVADLACHLHAMVFRGFAEALLSNVNYGRQVRDDYCLDELKLPTT